MRSPANAFVTSSAAAAWAADESPKIATTADSVVVIHNWATSWVVRHPSEDKRLLKTGIQSKKIYVVHCHGSTRSLGEGLEKMH
jgi:hypothetical protein